MKAKTRIKQRMVLEELRKNGGVVKHACERAGCGPTQFYEWLKVYPEFNQEVITVYQNLIGFCYAMLYRKANEGDVEALCALKRFAEQKLERMKRK